MPAEPREPDLAPRKRWMAARRLAAGDQPVVAAASAGVSTHALRLLLAEDPDFSALVDAFRALKALPREAKLARLEDLCWDGAERAVLDGRVSTLNLCLRTLRLVEAEEDEEEEDPMAAFLAGLSPEERADYEALGEVEEPEAVLATPMPAPSGEEAPSPSPRHGWPGQAGPRQKGESDLSPSRPLPASSGEDALPCAWPVHARLKQEEGVDLRTPQPLPPGLTGGPPRRARAADAAAPSTAPTPTPRTLPFIPAVEPVPSWLRQRLTDRAPQGP